ncbi:MAG: hypothetical protein JSR99_06285 [Proteobacteria bacterium]|nr:hypothetical protein [Pseudomonadota bacterium]
MTLLGMGALAPVASIAADATELCVKCTGPDASYACIVGGSGNATLDTVAKFYCITTLAKAGSHASCSIDRAITPPCPGERKELPIPAFLDGGGGGHQPQDSTAAEQNKSAIGTREANAPPAELETNPRPEPHNQAAVAPTSDQPPKTVQEMVEKSAQSAGDGLSVTQKSAGKAAKSATTALEKAGSAVGGAAKSSWKCLSSFFSNC